MADPIPVTVIRGFNKSIITIHKEEAGWFEIRHIKHRDDDPYNPYVSLIRISPDEAKALARVLNG